MYERRLTACKAHVFCSCSEGCNLYSTIYAYQGNVLLVSPNFSAPGLDVQWVPVEHKPRIGPPNHCLSVPVHAYSCLWCLPVPIVVCCLSCGAWIRQGTLPLPLPLTRLSPPPAASAAPFQTSRPKWNPQRPLTRPLVTPLETAATTRPPAPGIRRFLPACSMPLYPPVPP